MGFAGSLFDVDAVELHPSVGQCIDFECDPERSRGIHLVV